MSKLLERSMELRNDPNVHYNCAQGVFIPFAEEKGLSAETANAIGSNFGAGMKMASVCGAITGGLMALGLYGVEDGPTINSYYKRLKERHNGLLDCKDLLAAYWAGGGTVKKDHCDDIVYECVRLVEEILTQRGLLA